MLSSSLVFVHVNLKLKPIYKSNRHWASKISAVTGGVFSPKKHQKRKKKDNQVFLTVLAETKKLFESSLKIYFPSCVGFLCF